MTWKRIREVAEGTGELYAPASGLCYMLTPPLKELRSCTRIFCLPVRKHILPVGGSWHSSSLARPGKKKRRLCDLATDNRKSSKDPEHVHALNMFSFASKRHILWLWRSSGLRLSTPSNGPHRYQPWNFCSSWKTHASGQGRTACWDSSEGWARWW